MKVFVSHSSMDEPLVEALVELMRSSLRLSASDIRCSSVDGHRLSGGARTEETIRSEVNSADSFVVVLSSYSISSLWVAVEIGARWGAGKPLLPLLAPQASTDLLKGPLTNIIALRCDSRNQLHQFVHDLAAQMSISIEPPAVYNQYIERIL